MAEGEDKTVRTLIYDSKPYYDPVMKVILIGIPASLSIGGFYYLASGEMVDAVKLLGVALFTLALFWSIFPRRYLIFDDSIKIVLGKPFFVNIPFHKIELARVSREFFMGINWSTSIVTTYHVEIVRKRRLTMTNIAITPSDPNLFVENLNKALSAWRGE